MITRQFVNTLRIALWVDYVVCTFLVVVFIAMPIILTPQQIEHDRGISISDQKTWAIMTTILVFMVCWVHSLVREVKKALAAQEEDAE